MRVTSVLLVLGCACGAALSGAVRPPPLAVSRCCPDGQRLADAALLADPLTPALVSCVLPHNPNDTLWLPRVYAPARRALLDEGRIPAHWNQVVALPTCPSLLVLHHHAAPYALLANNASLVLRGVVRPLPTDRYCSDPAAALVCSEDIPRSLSKCCAETRAFDGSHCVEKPESGSATMSQLRAAAAAAGAAVLVQSGWPTCAEGSRYAVAGALKAGVLGADGSLRMEGGSLAAGAWCAEAVVSGEDAKAVVGEEGAHVLACAAEAGAAPSARHAVYGAGLAVGALFLAATLAAGFTLPAAHRALHWRCQTHYVAALFLGDVLLAATQLAGPAVPPSVCRALAVCMHFLFLAAFFWLNTMCFNIWWTFRDFRPTSLERTQEAWRLRVYQVYAWGGPLALAGAAALLDSGAGTGDALLRPRFAVRRCWFYGDTEVLVYFFGPVGVLLLVNLALFASTARQLACGLWRRDEVKSTSERAALGRVCAKLVVVMGVTWGADVVSWAAGGPHYLWYATDLLNALQGVLIFLVVGWHQHARAALRRAVGSCGGLRGARGGAAAARGGDPRPTHSSTHLPSCGESLTHTTTAPQPATPAPAPAAPTKIPMETVC